MAEVKTVLITDRFDLEARAWLESQKGLAVRMNENPTPEDFAVADGLIIRTRTRIHEGMLREMPRLQVIVSASSGYDHIDLDATSKAEITVMHTPDAHATSAAELTMALALACARKIPLAHHAVKVGEWRRESLTGSELNGKAYGIIGLGRIGRKVAAMAQAFGMKVTAFDPYIEQKVFDEARVERLGLEEVIKHSSVISLHVPYYAATHHMINQRTLEWFSPDTILLNTARGGLVCEEDLCLALAQKTLRAVGLDVFEREPLGRASRLLNFANVIMSPHIGANTEEARRSASFMAAKKIVSFLFHGEVSDGLPPAAAWWPHH